MVKNNVVSVYMSLQCNFRKFSLDRIDRHSVIVMIAKRKSGKTVLVKDILYHFADFPVALVISPTERKNRTYGAFIPDLFIYDEYNVSIVSKFLERQDEIIETYEEKRKDKHVSKEKLKKYEPSAALIFDDCLADNKWVKDKQIKEIFMNGRHSKMMFIFTMQYPLGVNPMLRTNIDFVFLLQENSMKNRRRLYEQYASVFPNFNIFCQTFDIFTENYGCMVIDTTSKSNKLEDTVFWYRAEIHESFKLGSKKYWNYHTSHYNPNYRKEPNAKRLSNDDINKNKNNIKINKV